MADHKRPISVQAIGWRDVVPLLQPGQMHVCVCQPGAGKSSLALSLARDLAARSADPLQVLCLSTDLSVPMLKWKLITAMTGVPYDTLESGTCSPAQLAAADQAQAAIASWPLVLMAPTDATADQLTTLIRQHASVRSTVVIVDYLGAEPPGVTTSSVQTMVRSLASIARELGIPIVATAGYAEDGDLDGADVILGLGLDADAAGDDQRNVDLFLLRSADGRIDLVPGGGIREIVKCQLCLDRMSVGQRAGSGSLDVSQDEGFALGTHQVDAALDDWKIRRQLDLERLLDANDPWRWRVDADETPALGDEVVTIVLGKPIGGSLAMRSANLSCMHGIASVHAQAASVLDPVSIRPLPHRLMADWAVKAEWQRKALDYRVDRLGRKEVDTNAIKLSRAAEILGLRLEDMRALAKRWGP